MAPVRLTPETIGGVLRPGMTVYAAGTAGESRLVADALAAAPESAAGVRFIGVWLPGMNRIDYAGLHPDARATAFFIHPPLRTSFAAGRIDLRLWSYHGIYRHLRERAAIDLAFVQVSPPDDDGVVSAGVANDFTPAILERGGRIIAHVNPAMPRTTGSARLPFESLWGYVDAEAPLVGDDEATDATFDAIGRHVAGLLDDGVTIEVGVGRVQSLFAHLGGRRRLKLHTGAISSSVLPLVASGAIPDESGAITTGIALGGGDLHDFVRDNPRVRFAPVGWTHDPATLRAIPRFVAINSVIEVDLLGQANAEMVDGRQVSGSGGLLDFMRGARLSDGGFSILALPATARGDTISRIVDGFAPGTAVSVPRGEVDVVVTEFGTADLRDKSLDARAEALIGVAAPAFRAALADAWDARRRRM